MKLACKVCGSTEIRSYCRKEEAHYYSCRGCGLLFQHPSPDAESMRRYADTEYDAGLYRQYVEAREMKLAHFRHRMQVMSPWIRQGRLLDVGCSCGYFLEVAAEAGYETRGLEFSSSAIAAASPKIRPRIRQASLDELSEEEGAAYEVITAFDIIEHLDRPKDFLAQAFRLLRPGGTLAVTTPDADHWLRTLMASRWPMLQPMQHLTLFSHRAIRRAMEDAGLQVVVLEKSPKILSCRYLIDQIRVLNPVAHRILSALSGVIPATVMDRQRQLNIGEVLAVAVKHPSGSR